MPHLLIVDDDDAVRSALADIARDSGFTIAQANTLKKAILEWERRSPDLVLLDVRLPDGNGLDIFDRVEIGGTDVAVISGDSSAEYAIAALRRGAKDYLIKPIDTNSLRRVFAPFHNGVVETAAHPLDTTHTAHFVNMAGSSDAMRQLYGTLECLAPTDITAFLVGESGTGKELAAHAIHHCSARRSKAFVPVNCGAIAGSLIESELFGHERGSFTGAERAHKGYFEQADGGTLFLDEVTEMPLEAQVKLLRVLESGTYMRVGSDAEQSCDVRVIAATNRNPALAVKEGRLRSDLYFRLNAFPVEIPPLRHRGDDVVLLAQRFLNALNLESSTRKCFSEKMVNTLRHHTWPGNVRELKNVVRRAYILADGDELDAADCLNAAAAPDSSTKNALTRVPVGATLADVGRHTILATLHQCGGVRKRAAEILGIGTKTLYNRLEAYAAAGYVVDAATEERNLGDY